MAADRRPVTRDFERFCECLNRYGVDFLVVGSEAVAFHGAPRFSVDFDVWVRPVPANLLRVAAGVEALGLKDLAAQIDPHLWSRTGATLRLGDPPAQIDVLLQLSGVRYDDVVNRAKSGRYGEVNVRFIGMEDLVTNKRAAGRAKDLADVDLLEKAGDDVDAE